MLDTGGEIKGQNNISRKILNRNELKEEEAKKSDKS